MKRLKNKLFSKKTFAIIMMVFVLGSSMPAPAFAALGVDVKANGSDGPITINSGDTYTYTWTSTDATACQQTSPLTGGAALSGSSITIGPSHPFYPTAGSSVTITISCTDGTTSISDSVVISLAGTPPPPPAGAPTVDVKANGSDGPVILASGSSYTYTWTSTNATACQQTSPATGGAALSGTSITIDPSHPFYPTVASSVTITIVCTNGTQSATDSVVISLAGTPPPPPAGTPTVDVKANGSDGPVTISNGSSYTYTWVSTNATACQQTSPATGGAALSGTSIDITPGHPFYPTTSSAVTITLVCTNGTANATDSVVVQLAGVSGSSPSVDVKANGSDGPVTITNGSTYTYTWVSANATACQQTTPISGGAALSGTSIAIGPGHPFYPGVGSPVTITFVCTNGTANATDSVVIQLAVSTSGGGGGGGGSRPATGTVLAGTTECPWIRDYMRIDFVNDPFEVMKLQAFLKTFMGYDYVTVNGVFDQATYTAVGQFQMQYRDEILTPWGHTAPTHYVYILTLKKINEIYCQQLLPLTTEQQNEIITFRNLINQPVYKEDSPDAPTLPVTGVGPGDDSGGDGYTLDNGQKFAGLAAAWFTFPDNLKDTMQCLYEFALILIVLYILGAVLKDVLYDNLPENVLKRFMTKWTAITLGLLAALVAAYFLSELCLILPLTLSAIFSVIWMAFYPKHETITKSWVIWRKKDEKTI